MFWQVLQEKRLVKDNSKPTNLIHMITLKVIIVNIFRLTNLS